MLHVTRPTEKTVLGQDFAAHWFSFAIFVHTCMSCVAFDTKIKIKSYIKSYMTYLTIKHISYTFFVNVVLCV